MTVNPFAHNVGFSPTSKGAQSTPERVSVQNIHQLVQAFARGEKATSPQATNSTFSPPEKQDTYLPTPQTIRNPKQQKRKRRKRIKKKSGQSLFV